MVQDGRRAHGVPLMLCYERVVGHAGPCIGTAENYRRMTLVESPIRGTVLHSQAKTHFHTNPTSKHVNSRLLRNSTTGL